MLTLKSVFGNVSETNEFKFEKTHSNYTACNQNDRNNTKNNEISF